MLSFNNANSSITVNLNGQKTRMIVDTGCKYDIISSRLYKSHFKNHELNSTEKRFTAYGQKEPLKCRGYFNTVIRVRENVINSNVDVIEGNAESLLARDSSFKLKVLTQVNSVWAVERLHNYLFGIKFTLLTNNKPLSSMFAPY